MSSPGIALTVYIRDGCHLCDAMLLELEAFREHQSFALKVVDITGDEDLESRFASLIPVLYADGQEISHFFLDTKALRQYFGETGI